MTRIARTSFFAGCAGALLLCVPCFMGRGAAQPKEGKMFANAIEQRSEIIRQIEETNRLLKEQNELLREALKRQDAK